MYPQRKVELMSDESVRAPVLGDFYAFRLVEEGRRKLEKQET